MYDMKQMRVDLVESFKKRVGFMSDPEVVELVELFAPELNRKREAELAELEGYGSDSNTQQ